MFKTFLRSIQRVADSLTNQSLVTIIEMLRALDQRPLVQGNLALSVTEFDGPGSIVRGMHVVVFRGPASAILQLPKAAAYGTGVSFLLDVAHLGAGTLTVAAAQGELVSGAATRSIAAGLNLHLASDGKTAWSGIAG